MTPSPNTPAPAAGEELYKQLEKAGLYDALVYLHEQKHADDCFCTTEISGAYRKILSIVAAQNDATYEKLVEIELALQRAYDHGNGLDQYQVRELLTNLQNHNSESETTKVKKERYYLADEQCAGLVKLVNAEIELNMANEDEAYNTFWEDIKMALGYAIVK